jgi:aldehyde dehydrogenase (NAD+)
MKEALAQLGVQSINEGTSTGINNFSNGAILESYSPVDGHCFSKTTTAADYEKVMQTATEALKHSRQCQRHNVGKLCVSLKNCVK